MTKHSTKTSARSFRGKGFSYRDISKRLKIPLSTVYLWTKDVPQTKEQKAQLIRRHIKAMQTGQKRALILEKLKKDSITRKLTLSAIRRVGMVSNRELRLVCTALYWAEGFKKDNRLGFANSDPNMIVLILKWLTGIEKVPKNQIRLRVGLNKSQQSRINSIEKKWSEITHIPLSQFQKPFYQKTKWKKTYPHPESYLGVLRIRANNQPKLFIKIKGMIEGLKQAKL